MTDKPKSTPAAHWREQGKPDPHGTNYNCERAALCLGDMTDDELANAVFIHGNERLDLAAVMAGATSPIVYLTAAKERIRWLSRRLVLLEEVVIRPETKPMGDDQLWTLIAQATAATKGILEIRGGCWDTLHECLNCGNRSEEKENEEGYTVEVLVHKPDCPARLKQEAEATLRGMLATRLQNTETA